MGKCHLHGSGSEEAVKIRHQADPPCHAAQRRPLAPLPLTVASLLRFWAHLAHTCALSPGTRPWWVLFLCCIQQLLGPAGHRGSFSYSLDDRGDFDDREHLHVSTGEVAIDLRYMPLELEQDRASLATWVRAESARTSSFGRAGIHVLRTHPTCQSVMKYYDKGCSRYARQVLTMTCLQGKLLAVM